MIVTAESGQRGYLLTGDERYLQPYQDALSAAPEALDQLLRATADNLAQRADVASVTALVKTKLGELARTIDLTRANRVAEALEILRTDLGRDVMQQIRSELDGVQLRALRAAEMESSEAQGLNRRLLLACLGALFLVITLGGVAINTMARNLGLIRGNHARTAALNAKLEQAVAERTAELTESNEEIQRFAYIVSHDLRAPLVNVMGFTGELETLKDELLAAGAKPRNDPSRVQVEEDFAESITFIRAATNKMEGLIAAILRLSREGRRTFRPERVDMTEMMKDLVAAHRHQADRVGAAIEVAKDLPAMVADRVALEQVFGNLLDNALKYLDPKRPGRIEIRGEVIGERVRVSVTDNGRGIAEHDHKRVFELFRRAGEQNKPGEGIGLAHVQTLVRSLGGRITLSSQPGAGATFTVILPLAPKNLAQGD